ncbi:MAG: hypothetical protein IPK74_22000 [Deltaproteobacteria bacterium]|nr:hypothetical protein [Deltaproteobacteria bacterium]
MTVMSQLLLWGFEADWELVERTPGRAPELAQRRGYVDTLARLVASSASNRALLRRFVAQRVAPGWRCDDDVSEGDEVELLVELTADAIARGLFELRAIPRAVGGRWEHRASAFDEPALPLHTLIRDPVPTEQDTTFVAFIVVDQDFHPLAGRFVCTIDADDRRGDLRGQPSAKPIHYAPIRVRARVELDVTHVRAGSLDDER